MTDELKSFLRVIGGQKGTHCAYPVQIDMAGRGCTGGCKYCLSPDTLVTMYDLSTKRIDELVAGDVVVGTHFGDKRKYVKSTVEHVWTTDKPMYEIKLANGTSVKCSGDHRWLTERGWKYTSTSEQGDQRPHLTTNNSIRVMHSVTGSRPPSDMYRIGYVSGTIRGDAHVGTHVIYNKSKGKTEVLHQFNLRANDVEMVSRTSAYLSIHGINTYNFREGKLYGIRSSSSELVGRIRSLIETVDDVEYYRGFLAGIFDAEGSYSCGTMRISNSDVGILDTIQSALDAFGFTYNFDSPQEAPNTIVHSIRITGGRSEHIRFFQLCDPAISRKRSVMGTHPIGKSRILSIERVSECEKLYDIQTSTEDFIANGLVSHNCYARSLLDFRGNWNGESPAVADIDKVRRLFVDAFDKEKDTKDAKSLRECGALRIGGMTDPLLHNREHTHALLELCNEYNLPYLLFTKGDVKPTIPILDRDLATVQLSLGTLNDEWLRKCEPGAPHAVQRLRSIRRCKFNDIRVIARVAPIIPHPDLFNMAMFRTICDWGPDGIIGEMIRYSGTIGKQMQEIGFDYKKVFPECQVYKRGQVVYHESFRDMHYADMLEECDKRDIPFSVCENDGFDFFKKYWKGIYDNCCMGVKQ